MGGLFIVTVLFFILMPVLTAAVCCYLYNKDDVGGLSVGRTFTERTPLV